MRSFIIDLDGTIYHGHRPIKYAQSFIQYLQKKKIPYIIMTNAPERRPEEIVKVLKGMEIELPEELVVTSATLTMAYLKKQVESSRKVHIVGNAYLKELAEANGYILSEEAPDVEVIAFDEAITVADVKKACRNVSGGARLFATNADKIIPTDFGVGPHTGWIVDGIETATKKKAEVIGKPSHYSREFFVDFFQAKPEEICMVGDYIDTDMAFAKNCGFQAYLLLTGNTSASEAAKYPQAYDRCFQDLKALMEYLEQTE